MCHIFCLFRVNDTKSRIHHVECKHKHTIVHALFRLFNAHLHQNMHGITLIYGSEAATGIHSDLIGIVCDLNAEKRKTTQNTRNFVASSKLWDCIELTVKKGGKYTERDTLMKYFQEDGVHGK